MRLIETRADIDEGLAFLATLEPRFARAMELVGEVPLRRRPQGFGELLHAIVGQQVSTASAAAIWARVEAAGLSRADSVLAASEESLRGVGLSRSKARYAKALAEASIDFAALAQLANEDIIAQLTQVPGIGKWTAEIYVMFSLGRADVFAPGDLALQEAARLLFDLDTRPKEPALRTMAAGWSPWRGVAARLLWAYYRQAKDREGIGP